MGLYERRNRCQQPACGGDYLAYCNAYPDLQNANCGGNWCTTDAEFSVCKTHFEIQGRWENRDQCLKPACDGDYLAYCNAWPDLQNAICGGNWCTTDAETAVCKTHFETQGRWEPRDRCLKPACDGDYLAYCNAYPDLQNTICGGNRCTTDAEFASCKTHFEKQGQWENRDQCLTRRILYATTQEEEEEEMEEEGEASTQEEAEDTITEGGEEENDESARNSRSGAGSSGSGWGSTRRLLNLLNRFNNQNQ